MYHLTQSKHGISSIELGRRLGVTQTTAWKMKTKLAEVMRRSSDKDRLQGRIEMDDAYLGGERSGGKTGRGSPGKTPIIAAVETTDDGKPKRLKIRRIARFKRKRVPDYPGPYASCHKPLIEFAGSQKRGGEAWRATRSSSRRA
jgi:hypothetical protein